MTLPAAGRLGLFTPKCRINRRWTVGRYDRSGEARDASLVDTGFSTL
jgi:hypothetical protein